MSVELVLDKISAHNSDVLGCIAKSGDQIFANLPELYDLIDQQDVAEHAENLFAVTNDLEADEDTLDQLFLQYEHHSIFARRIDDGVLLILNKPMERSQVKKMQLGVNLFLKPLKRALADAKPPEPQPETSGAIRKTKRRRWF